MRRFEFRLASVLSWRQLQLEMEQARLESLFAELRRIRARLAGLEAEKDACARAVLGREAVAGAELSALEEYLKHAARRRDALLAESAACKRRIAEQRRRVLEAERNTRLLERLKERRLAEWRSENDRELEALATESFLAHWTRES
jgi:flagellar FliJ protein